MVLWTQEGPLRVRRHCQWSVHSHHTVSVSCPKLCPVISTQSSHRFCLLSKTMPSDQYTVITPFLSPVQNYALWSVHSHHTVSVSYLKLCPVISTQSSHRFCLLSKTMPSDQYTVITPFLSPVQNYALWSVHSHHTVSVSYLKLCPVISTQSSHRFCLLSKTMPSDQYTVITQFLSPI